MYVCVWVCVCVYRVIYICVCVCIGLYIMKATCFGLEIYFQENTEYEVLLTLYMSS